MKEKLQDRLPGSGDRLNRLLEKAGLPGLDSALVQNFETFLALLLRWNARVNLTAIRDEEGVLSRHFVESIACAHALPQGIGTLLDLGSGAGFPGIPIALCRPEIAVTLAESQNRKAAFLQEAVRVLGLRVRVHSGRAETLERQFHCVTLRAVDRMQSAVRAGVALVSPAGCLAVMTTASHLQAVREAAGKDFSWNDPVALPGGAELVLALGIKASLPA